MLALAPRNTNARLALRHAAACLGLTAEAARVDARPELPPGRR